MPIKLDEYFVGNANNNQNNSHNLNYGRNVTCDQAEF